MKSKNFTHYVVMVVLLSWICLGYFACEWTPERDNPLDPNSDLYHPLSLGSIAGEVRNLSGNLPLSGVMVDLESCGQGVVTGSNGRYSIEDVVDGQHWVKIHKEGYLDDSTQVTVVTGEVDTTNFRMNALPVLDSVSVTQHRIHIGGLIYNDFVTVYARITDVDMNVSTLLADTAVLVIFETDTMGKLSYSDNQVSGFFTFDRDFQFSEFSVGNVQDIVGRPFTLIAMDQGGGYNVSGPYSVIRYLDAPRIDHPTSAETVFPTPTLTWYDYGAQFSYIQDALIFNNNDILVWDSLGIAPGILQITVTDSLPPTGGGGPVNYYWTLEVVDPFGNTGLSEKHNFFVQE